MPWTEWNGTYTQEDVDAFLDPERIDQQFGLPDKRKRVFSVALHPNGNAKPQDRIHYLSNLLAFRCLKTHWPDAWIWDERYRFAGEPGKHDRAMIHAQCEFIRLFREDRATKIADFARQRGLDPAGKTNSRPDLAVYFPTEDVWRFIELKIPEKGDTLRPKQRDWLCLLATHLGPESAVEWRWDKR